MKTNILRTAEKQKAIAAQWTAADEAAREARETENEIGTQVERLKTIVGYIEDATEEKRGGAMLIWIKDANRILRNLKKIATANLITKSE